MIAVREGGVLLVDKPVGPTSHDIVGRARKALGTRKIGHTGTLDPFASGLLALCVDAATRLAEYLTGMDKVYEAVAVLGVGTDTLDREGAVLETDEAWKNLGQDEIEAALGGLRGDVLQVPPQFSAKKIGGEAMYRKARRGETVELEPVPVRIGRLELLELELPRVRLLVECSSGTYVRGVARDLGAALGTAAHLDELRRTAVGGFSVDRAVPADSLDDPEAVSRAWLTPAEALAHLPRIRVNEELALRLARGQSVEATGSTPEGVPVAVELDGALAAVGERQGGLLKPRKVFLRV